MEEKKYEIAKWLHNIYEEVATKNKWATQKITKVEFDKLPIANKNTMLVVSEKILDKFINKDEIFSWKIYATIIENYAKKNGIGNNLDRLMLYLDYEVHNKGQIIYLKNEHKNKKEILKLLEE
jgi:hypothetical protein